jgi:two-component system phosphate regulon sensor histidine kinase PhoR
MEEGLIILNETGKIVTINQSGANFFNVDEKELIGKHFSVASRNLKLLDAVEGALRGEAQEETFEEHGRSFQFRATPVLQDGVVAGGVLMVFDVTEKRKTEMIRREFSANVSHELKTPLTAILGYAEILKNRMAEGEDAVDFAGRIHDEARGLLTLIEDIIRLSQLDEGNLRMPMETVDLMTLAREVTDRLLSTAAGRGLQLELTGESGMVKAIPSMLEELLMNLVDNAIKYNMSGGRVTVEIRRENGKIILEVADTGIGIPKEHQERIFERFYRVDKSHSKSTGGTGLGLSIVKHIAEFHQAVLSLESEEGKGTKIRIEFQAV